MIIEKFHVIQPNGRKRLKVKYLCKQCNNVVETHLDNYNSTKSKDKICRRCSAPKNAIPGSKKGRKYPNLQKAGSHLWKGGRRVDSSGYVLVHIGTGRANKTSGWSCYKKEHSVVMEAHLGRPMEAGEVIHHIDGNRQNNSLANLAVLSSHLHHRGSHQSLQEIGYQLVKCGFVIFDQEIGKYVAHDKLRELLEHPDRAISSQAEKSEGSETRGEIIPPRARGSRNADDIVRTTQECVELKDKEPLG